MKRDYRDYIEDILKAIDEVAEFIAGMNQQEFMADRKTTNAVLRSLEVLGDAAKQIPDELRVKAPDVPWRRMAGMRDKLIHEYFGVDLSIVWTVCKEELPPLKADIESLLKELKE